MSSRAEADLSKSALRGCKIKGQPRPIRIKFANQGTSIEIKNLSPMISNERLYDAFVRFGKIERAVVLVDEKGKSLEKGIVEFDRKNSASRAIEQVNNGCFFLTKSPRAIVCGPVEAEDADDGLREEQLYNVRGFQDEYNHPPRFAGPETYEMDFGNRWKAIEELERSQLDQVKNESAERKRRLEQEMIVGMAQEQERLIRLDMERQHNELKRMEEQRVRQQSALRARHDAEMEAENRNRQSVTEQHKRLRELVEGGQMKSPGDYKAPPNWQPPQSHLHQQQHQSPQNYHSQQNYNQQPNYQQQPNYKWHNQSGDRPNPNDRSFNNSLDNFANDYQDFNHDSNNASVQASYDNDRNSPFGGRGGGRGGAIRGNPRGAASMRGGGGPRGRGVGGARRGPY